MLIKEKQHYKESLLTVSYLGIIFMLLYSAYTSYLNLISQIYSQIGCKYLGNVAIFSLYGAFSIGNITATRIVQNQKPKVMMIVSDLCISLFIASGIFVEQCVDSTLDICSHQSIYTIVTIIAIISGYAGSLIWVAQSQYMEQLYYYYPEKKGLFFGIFWGIMQFSQSLGMLLAWIILSFLNQNWYFIIMTIIALLTNILYALLPNLMDKTNTNIKQNDQIINKQQDNLIQKLQNLKELANTQGIKPVMIFFGFSGVIIAFYSGVLYQLINESLPGNTDQQLLVKTTLVFIALGLSEMITGFISGNISDKIDFTKLTPVANSIAYVAIIICILIYFLKSYLACFFCAIFWGSSDCLFMNLSSIICTKMYQGKLEAFALFRLVQGLAVTITLVINILLQDQEMYYIILIVLLFCIINNIATRFIVNRTSKIEETILQDQSLINQNLIL